ncbi:hypothetical protein Pmani_008973 [Petrolisthes manimaculis]|uniref:Peptidase S1 domain-containing protein n=1 Tax=Petrolisthes manimaculis TaxID=1843537 RepID=A0AAE1Q7C7_9EUCA|nr:hypothetical protein Pmani_008973 [Petrolisthes manimaculis]
MKVDKCVVVLVIVVVLLMMPEDGTTTKPKRKMKRRSQTKSVKSFGEMTELGTEMKQCGTRRVVQSDGSVKEITTPFKTKNIKPIIVDRKGVKAKCGNEYEMEAGTKMKAKLVGRPQECEMLFMATEGAELEVTCKKFKITSCDQEILFMTDDEDLEETYCNDDKPDAMKGKNIMYMIYERDRKKRYKGSKIMCSIKAVECGAAKINSGADRIVGGSEAKVGEYPWMITFGVDGEDDDEGFVTFCGGSIITTTHILTAAHCIDQENIPPTLIVVAGEHDLSTSSESDTQRMIVDSITIHPNYDIDDVLNDIAILTLTKPLTFTKGVQPVCLAPADELHEGKTAIVTGWGNTFNDGDDSDVLLEVTVNVYTNEECSDAYDEDIPDTMVCAADKGKDSCNGDSGGPMVLLDSGVWQEIGIVSWGAGCADPNFPGVYTRVSKYIDWIVSTVEAQNGSC